MARNQYVAKNVASLVFLLIAWSAPLPTYAVSDECVQLNNEGVRALNAGNFELAIKDLEEAINADPTYPLARQNLGVTHNNMGLQYRHENEKSLRHFYQAFLIDPTNKTTEQNISGILTMMGRVPGSFEDRALLG